MTEIQLGKVMLTPKGEYDSTKTYTRLDAVTYQGSSYVCLADTSDAPPTANWQLLADKGATGDVGPQGPKGDKGDTGATGPAGPAGKDGQTPDVSKLATKTDLANYYTKAETDTKLSTKADQAEYQALNDKFNNMQIGGRNLVAGTAEPYVMGFGIPTTTWQNGYAYEKLPTTLTYSGIEVLPQDPHTFYYTLTKGTTYTQTIWFETDAKLVKGSVIQFTWFTSAGHDGQPATLISLGENKYKIYSTYTWPGKSDNNVRLFDTNNIDVAFDLSTGTYLKFGKLKLEKGNVSTDWTPAPEDFDTKLDAKADKSELPDLSGYAKTSDIPTDVVTHAELANATPKIDASLKYMSKKPSDYTDGIFYEEKYISTMGIDRSSLDSSAQTGTYGLVTTKVMTINGTKFARQQCEVIDSQRPITFLRNGYSNSWSSWEVNTTLAF